LFSLDEGTGIYKFGNNTYPRRIRRRSNLGHIFSGKKLRLMGREIGTISHCDNVCVHLTSDVVRTWCTRASPGTSSSSKDWPFYFLKHSGRVLPVSLHPAIHVLCV